MSAVPGLPANMCPLCAYTGSNVPEFDDIMSFVPDNTHRVHLDELVTQVRTALQGQLGIDMPRAQIREHFLSHQCDQKVVLHEVMRDLVGIIAVAKTTCIVSTEQGVSMDPKNTSVYIDAVKQLMCIYKQLDNVARTK